MSHLSTTIGAQPLTKAILDFMKNMLLPDKRARKKRLLSHIRATRNKTHEETGLIGGNIATLMTYYNHKALKSINLSGCNLSGADFNVFNEIDSSGEKSTDLSSSNLEGANLQGINFSHSVLSNANLSYALFDSDVNLPFISESTFYEVALALDNSFLVAGGRDGIVKLWWLANGSEQIIARNNWSWINFVALSSDGKLLAVGDINGYIKVYHIQSSKTVFQVNNDGGWVIGLDFDLERNCLIAANGGFSTAGHSIYIYSLSDLTLRWVYQHDEPFMQMFYDGASGKLVTLDILGGIDVWDVEMHVHIETLASRVNSSADDQRNRRIRDKIEYFSCNAGCTQILIARYLGPGYILQILKIPGYHIAWEQNIPSSTILPDILDTESSLKSVALNNSSNIVAMGFSTKLILWDVLNDRELWRNNEYQGSIRRIVFSQDDKYMVTGSQDDMIRIWDVKSGKAVRVISTGKYYNGLRLTGAKGLDERTLRALAERGAIIDE